jgi:hypothetical protein
MAMIYDLVLTLSKSTDGTVGVKVSYTATFSTIETSLEFLEFYDAVAIHQRKGVRDDVRPPGAAGDPDDVMVATFATGGNFTPFGAKDGKIVRSFERPLTSDELATLREVGREHPYVTVTLRPVDIALAQESVELDQIDIGDPGE